MIAYVIDEAPIYKRYQNEEENVRTSLKITHAHEAGFDAYMAGCVFLTTSKYREIGAMMESQKLSSKAAQKQKRSPKGSKRKRDLKAEDKDTVSTTARSSTFRGQLWMDLRGEKVDFTPMQPFHNRIVLDLNDRYFDFSEEFDGKETNFDVSNVIWIRWAKREAPLCDKEDWSNNRVKYPEGKVEIIVSRLAEILSNYGDVTIVKDSKVSAFVEFTSCDPANFKRSVGKRNTQKNVLKHDAVLKDIQSRLEQETGIETFEVLPYEKADKFSSKFIHE
jgi:hypothetical protein